MKEVDTIVLEIFSYATKCFPWHLALNYYIFSFFFFVYLEKMTAKFVM